MNSPNTRFKRAGPAPTRRGQPPMPGYSPSSLPPSAAPQGPGQNWGPQPGGNWPPQSPNRFMAIQDMFKNIPSGLTGLPALQGTMGPAEAPSAIPGVNSVGAGSPMPNAPTPMGPPGPQASGGGYGPFASQTKLPWQRGGQRGAGSGATGLPTMWS